LYAAGADYVVDDITHVPKILRIINQKLALGFGPPGRIRN
ncbi:hypothetical protein LCGC14_2446330, partial [marine sediment metagenome]